MSMTTLDAERDLRKVERALKRREREIGRSEVIVMGDQITEADRDLFGRPVRFEVDVCIPIADLKTLLNGIRADLGNAIKILETTGPANDRRFSAHRCLCRARAKAFRLRQDLLTRGKLDAQ